MIESDIKLSMIDMAFSTPGSCHSRSVHPAQEPWIEFLRSTGGGYRHG
jgi:hypothetical protein